VFNLFDCTAGRKVLVLRFASVEAAKAHAVELYGAIAGEDQEDGYIDLLTVRGAVLAIEPDAE